MPTRLQRYQFSVHAPEGEPQSRGELSTSTITEAEVWGLVDAIKARLEAEYPTETFTSYVTKWEQTDTDLTHP